MGLPDVRVRVSTVPVSCYLARTANITRRVALYLRTRREKARVAKPREGGCEPADRLLDEGRYWDKRERERERCISAADASTYGPCMGTQQTPGTNVPN